MTIIELTNILDEQRPVTIVRLGIGCIIAEFDSIYSVELRFSHEEVINVDFNTDSGNFVIYI